MNILKVEKHDKVTTITIELVVNKVETPLVPIKITKRWENAAKQLARMENIVGQQLKEICAGIYNPGKMYKDKTQEFTFYYST